MQLEEINKKERDKWSYKLAEIIKYKPNDILLLKCPECSYKTENKVFYKPRDLIKVWENKNYYHHIYNNDTVTFIKGAKETIDILLSYLLEMAIRSSFENGIFSYVSNDFFIKEIKSSISFFRIYHLQDQGNLIIKCNNCNQKIDYGLGMNHLKKNYKIKSLQKNWGWRNQKEWYVREFDNSKGNKKWGKLLDQKIRELVMEMSQEEFVNDLRVSQKKIIKFKENKNSHRQKNLLKRQNLKTKNSITMKILNFIKGNK